MVSLFSIFNIVAKTLIHTKKNKKTVPVMGVTCDFKRAFIMRNIKKKDTIALTQHLKGHICVKESANVKANTSLQKHMRYGISGSKIRLECIRLE